MINVFSVLTSDADLQCWGQELVMAFDSTCVVSLITPAERTKIERLAGLSPQLTAVLPPDKPGAATQRAGGEAGQMYTLTFSQVSRTLHLEVCTGK